MKKLKFFAMFILFIMLLSHQVVYADDTSTIRVGFPVQSGFTEVGRNGKYSGYTYEYLMEISQYTGWEYQFVPFDGRQKSLDKMMEMLKNGELDIVGSLRQDEELSELYDYAENSYGNAYSTLWILSDNKNLNVSNYQRMENLKIAVIDRGDQRNAELEAFCISNGMEVEFLHCQNKAEQLALLRSGQADIISGIGLNQEKDLMVLDLFAPYALYFITTKGNETIKKGLNLSISKIANADPYFSATLYDKYFNDKAELDFTEQELEFIKNSRRLKVMISSENRPIEWYDKKEGRYKGISVDMFEKISEITGLKFTYSVGNDMETNAKRLNKGEIDMVLGVPYDYNLSREYHIAFTRPYLTCRLSMVKEKENNKTGILAAQTGISVDSVISLEDRIKRYDSVKGCLEAIRKGEADYTYANSYILEYYLQNHRYKKLAAIPVSDGVQNLCIAVAKPVNMNLLSILNKGIMQVTEDEMQQIIFQNTMMQEEISLGAFIESNPSQIIIAVILFFGAVIIAIFYVMHNRQEQAKELELEHERYKLLADMSNDYIYEYDYEKDKLTISSQAAQLFGIRREYEHWEKQLTEKEVVHFFGDTEPIKSLLYRNTKSAKKTCDIMMKVRDGSKRWFHIIQVDLRQGIFPVYAIGKLTDVQENYEERETLLDRSRRDGMTKLYNAEASREIISGLLESTKIGGGALMILDVDYFKSVNDTLGHYTGDQVIKDVASLLQNTFRKNDVVGRLGGDEFVVFMRDETGKDEIDVKCLELQENVHHLLEEYKTEKPLSISIGVTISKGEEANFDVLYKRADGALYQAKESGRGCHRFSE